MANILFQISETMHILLIKSTGTIKKQIVWLTTLTAVVSVQGFAEVSADDIAEALSPFPRAEIVEQSSRSVEDYSLALGEMKKIRDLWRPERERRLAGNLQRLTMQIPDGHNPLELFNFYQRKMRNVSARILFECDARNCGSSNAWANEQFENKLLFGLDQQQRYGAYELVDDQGFLNYVVLYTVIRGNKRVYAHTEWLQTDNESNEAVAPSADEVTSYLRNQGYYVISGITLNDGKISIDDEHLQAIVNSIRVNRRFDIRIVGHGYGTGSLDEQIQRSSSYAEQVLDILVGQGIPAQRLSSHGVGSLSPAITTASNQEQLVRIELVAVSP
jgi:outer membrane protein OmpA-like peptidoglycan-associated protein